MNSIRIVEYHKKYAAGLAKMWNMSADSWGGFDVVETEESVIRNLEGSENLKTWVALDGDEVVGYCSFSEYKEDRGASYIPLLNVRPDYHGKKVGKLLVLRTVEEACRHPWPRLDLYTWPGNTKAVPLYKKCGFFWEDRDDSTHLMNFIPYVLGTEAVADFFQQADWYADSVREIQVQPDGRQENGFEYYEYRWRHGGSMLRMEFERRGRGLRLIETEDWLVEAAVEDMNLAFGRSYTVRFRLVNKSGKPLQVGIRGKDDENISFSLERSLTVEGEEVVEGRFQVGEINEEQNTWRTHPGVCADIFINGKQAQFKVGIVPKFPAAIQAVLPEKEHCVGSAGTLFLNVENGFNEPASFKLTLPQADFVDLDRQEVELDLQAGEKKAVPVAYTLRDLGLLQGTVKISARPGQGGTIEFQRPFTALFSGCGAAFTGEDEKRWFAVNGRFLLSLSKFNNLLEVSSLEREPYYTRFLRPQVGLPYSVEFAKARPRRVEQGVEGGAAYIRATYLPQSHPGLEVERRVCLQADGLAWQSWSFRNTGKSRLEKLWFRAAVHMDLSGAVLPLAGKAVEVRDGYGQNLANFPIDQLSENWIFSRAGRGRGLCWSPQLKPITTQGLLCFDHDLGNLEPGAEVALSPVTLSLGTYRHWQDFRTFALKQNAEHLMSSDSTEVQVNGGNPFVQEDYELRVREQKIFPFAGEVKAVVGNRQPMTASIQGSCAGLSLPAPAPSDIDLVQVEASTESVLLRRRVAVFGVGGRVNESRAQRQGMEVLTVDNGCLSFAAAPDFAPALISLKYRGREWLDSSFPEIRAKSWWNPWPGGSFLEIDDLSMRSLLRQPRSISFITLADNLGNEWQGLEIQADVREHEKFQGLRLSHYALTLPGLAGLCMFVKVQHSGLAVEDVECCNLVFLAPGGEVADSWAEFTSPQGERVRFKQGCGLQSPRLKKLAYGSPRCQEQLLTFSAADTDAYTNKEVILFGSFDKFILLPGRTLVTPPQFFLFVQEDIPAGALEPLAKLRF
jgi:GNAT superfamily N-acetyltransferase